jgi:phosphopantothenoylcysteine synthetase/decarboxylase
MADPSPAPRPLTRVVLGVTGGIAAFKAAELARLFVKDGVAVDVAMTEAATRFVTPMTFQALTGRPVATDLWTSGAANAMDHIAMSRGADLIVVAPGVGRLPREARARDARTTSCRRCASRASARCSSRPR